MVNTRLTLRGGGRVVDLGNHIDRYPAGAAALDDGMDGLGLPPVSPRFFEGAGDGSSYRGTRVLAREITIPILFVAPDRPALRSLVSNLAYALAPQYAPATLVYTDPDGSSWVTEVVRSGSGTPVTDGETYYRLDLALTAPDPFWTREEASTALIEPAGTGRGLLRPGGSLSHLRLASGQVQGNVVIENPGDAHAYPVTTLLGPATYFLFRSNSGECYEWSGKIAAGERRIFDHAACTATDAEGRNCYAELLAAPHFWPVPPGVQTAWVDVRGSDPGTPQPDGSVTGRTAVSVAWRPRRWLML